MAAKFFIIAVACLFFGLNAAALETVDGRLKVQIQITAACGDTIRFITNQLVPTYDLYKDFLDIEFVSWGRASREEDGTLVCQFGPNDCFANRVQRCALELLKDDQDAQIRYMSCENVPPHPSLNQQSYNCAHEQGVNLVDLDYCVFHTADELERRDEIIGSRHIAELGFVPSLVFNDVFDVPQHQQGLSRFKNVVCLALAADPSSGITECEI